MQQESLVGSPLFSELLHQLYGSVVVGDWRPFLQLIMETTNSNKAFVSLKKTDPNSPLFMNITAKFDMPVDALVYYQQRPFDDPFFFDYVRYLPEGETIRPDDFININEYSTSEFSKKVLTPLRCHYVLGALLLRDHEHDAFFILNRGEEDDPFSYREQELIEQLKPHIQQSMRLFTLFRDVTNKNDMLSVVLNQNDKALLVINSDRKIKLSNHKADALLDNMPCFSIAGNRFRLKNTAENLRFQQLIEAYLQNDILNNDRLYLQLTETGIQLSLSIAPLRWLKLDSSEESLFLLTISYQQNICWQGVKEEYDLTSRELELVIALHSNQKLKDLSAEFEISYNTLRCHLRAIFKKCRINSQSELMLLLNQFS